MERKKRKSDKFAKTNKKIKNQFKKSRINSFKKEKCIEIWQWFDLDLEKEKNHFLANRKSNAKISMGKKVIKLFIYCSLKILIFFGKSNKKNVFINNFHVVKCLIFKLEKPEIIFFYLQMS